MWTGGFADLASMPGRPDTDLSGRLFVRFAPFDGECSLRAAIDRFANALKDMRYSHSMFAPEHLRACCLGRSACATTCHTSRHRDARSKLLPLQ